MLKWSEMMGENMIFPEIVNNAALLLILGIVQSFIQHRWIFNSTWGQIIRGALFGVVAVAAMSLPVKFSPGIIFDGRSVVLSIGGLFGGPIVALIASFMAICFRIFLGGEGMLTGVGSILIATASGLFYRFYLKGDFKKLNFGRLLLFGFFVHVILIGWFITLPGGIFPTVIHEIAPRYLSVFPLATAILGGVIVDQELRNIAEERSRIDSQKYRTVLETAPDIVMTFDPEGKIQFINHIPEWFGDSSILNESASSFLDDSQQKIFQEMLEHVFSTRENLSDEFLVHAPNGKQKWYSASFGFMEDDNQMKRVVVVAKDITQQMKDFETIQLRTREITTLYEIGQLMSSTLDLEFIYDSFYQRVSRIMPCDNLTISSFNPIEKKIRCEYFRLDGKTIDPSTLPPHDLEEESQGLQSQVIRNQKAMIIDDVQQQAHTAQNAYNVDQNGSLYPIKNSSQEQDELVQSGILVPIILNREVVGVIQVFSYTRDAYGEQELRFLQAIAAQIAVASNNAKLYEDLRLAYDKTLEGWSTALQMR